MSAATLKAATLALLNSGTGWTQGALARRANNTPCSPMHPAAVKYDVMGALIRALHDSTEIGYSAYHTVYEELRAKIPAGHFNEDLESYNDEATWAQIAALFA